YGDLVSRGRRVVDGTPRRSTSDQPARGDGPTGTAGRTSTAAKKRTGPKAARTAKATRSPAKRTRSTTTDRTSVRCDGTSTWDRYLVPVPSRNPADRTGAAAWTPTTAAAAPRISWRHVRRPTPLPAGPSLDRAGTPGRCPGGRGGRVRHLRPAAGGRVRRGRS